MSRIHGTKDFWLAALRADGNAFLATIGDDGARRRSVPSCPGWTVGELTRHLGAAYRRVRLNAGSAGPDESWGPIVIPDDAPAEDDPAIVSWFGAELAHA